VSQGAAQFPTTPMDGAPVRSLLDQAAKLLRAATHQFEQDQSELRRLVEYHPNTHHGVLAVEWMRHTRRELFYQSGSVPGRLPDGDGQCGGRLAALAQRIGGVRLVYHPDALADAVRRAFACGMRERGAGVRVSVAHESGLAIFDRRWALVWDNVPDCGQHCLLIRAPAVVKPLVRLADATWESALDLEVLAAFRDPGVDAVAMKVIGLLSAGHKDDVAASQLGVSVRTFRRYVADIMGRLGAESRFEAGVRAATLGLVDLAATQTPGRPVPGSLSLTAPAATKSTSEPARSAIVAMGDPAPPDSG
jgi:hypothetical protein